MSDLHVAHCEGVTSDNFIVNSLSKLAFTMSDRASNEKLADKLLSQWRDDIIKHCDNELQIQSVKNFHCMAHVLLGFHNYICADMKSLEKQIVQDSGPLGRDNLPAQVLVKSWYHHPACGQNYSGNLWANR
ncbi:hypothetical protein DPMN_168574 [Dreissena polymorpha]|uniref:Uncharacterized protein n=1 Tax=Dreissena polymorpha TaxID=45954 RepID=A0A9D4F0X6_DREPO|nr:hypothetical protein DPMN_168574 [Dreissena polymorpha]